MQHCHSLCTTLGLVLLLHLGFLFPSAVAETPEPEEIEFLERHFDKLEKRWAGARADAEFPNFPAQDVKHFEGYLDLLETWLPTLGEVAAAPLLKRLEDLRAALAVPETEVEEASTESVDAPRPLPSILRPTFARVAPSNDDCAGALPLAFGQVSGSLSGAINTGSSMCVNSPNLGADVWYRFTSPVNQAVAVRLLDPDFGLRVSVHVGCPATTLNQLVCGEDRGIVQALAGEEYLVRVFSTDDVSDSDFTLEFAPAGSISGRVTAVDGGPVEGITLRLDQAGGSFFGSTSTDAAGDYTLEFAEAGTYVVRTMIDEEFQNQTRDALTVGMSEARTGIDFVLDRLGTISGTVTEGGTGAPLAEVTLLVSETAPIVRALSDAQGHYRLEGLPAGSWEVKAQSLEHRDEVYDDIPCQPNCGDGDGVTVELNQETSGIDFELDPLGGFSGRVTDAVTGAPIPLLRVLIDDAQGSVTSRTTDMDGEYVVGGLLEGTYFAVADSSATAEYFDEAYDDIPCAERSCTPQDSTPIEVVFGTVVPGIDFALEPTGRLRGNIRSVATGDPILNVRVLLTRQDGSTVSGVEFSDAAGNYSLPVPATGTYFVSTRTFDFMNEAWDDIPCPLPGCDPTVGTPVFAAVDQETTGIDFQLDSPGILRGRVVDRSTGQALSPASVLLIDGEETVGSAGTDEDGRYEFPGVLPGTYRLQAQATGYVNEYYNGMQCPGNAPECNLGTPVEVELNGTLSGLDFRLERQRLGTVVGTVRGPEGEDLRNGSIALYDSTGLLVGGASVSSAVTFTASLSPGTYFARFDAPTGYLDRIWPNRPCTPEACDPLTGMPIIVRRDQTTRVDFVVDRQGLIRGTVVDAEIGAPSQVGVRISDSTGRFLRLVSVGGGGTYQVDALPPGDYFVNTQNTSGFFDQVHPQIPCAEQCDPTVGTPVSVDRNTARTVNFVLEPQQGLTGRVISGDLGVPVFGGTITAWTEDGRRGRSVSINTDGRYYLPLALGNYYLVATGTGLFDTLYPNIPCGVLGCDFSQGTLITAPANSTTRGIDFVAEGAFCNESPFSQCLQNERFRATLSFRGFEGDTTQAQPFPLTDDTGAFYFFGPDNLEVVVKVLDACVAPFNHFWVFAAGLTNLEFTLQVVDTWTGEVRLYENQLGEAFQLVRDTTAFATCDVGAGRAHRPDSAEEQRQLFQHVRQFTALHGTPESRGTDTCTPAATHLCLAEGRFKVEALWRTPDGELGTGQAFPLTADTGYFWFFDQDNVEVLTKVLDACTLEGFNSFWVFAAGLTDVEVSLLVTDTLSNETKEYFNPAGSPFTPVQDTRAFETCP